MDAAEFELMCEADAKYGDPRRCPQHGVAISSPDGLIDGECGRCESERDAREYELPSGWENAPLSAQIAFLVAGDDPELFDQIKAELKGEEESPF